MTKIQVQEQQPHLQPEQQQQQQQQIVNLTPLLPSELLSSIFVHLSTSTLYNCILVCSNWYSEAKPHLYRTVHLNGRRKSHQIDLAYLQAYKAHKRDIRTAIWRPGYFREFSTVDMLDIKQDIQEDLPVDVNPANSYQTTKMVDTAVLSLLNDPALARHQQPRDKTILNWKTFKNLAAIPLGPNRPCIQKFEFRGRVESVWLFESVIFNLSMLTTLSIYLDPEIPKSDIHIEIDLVLDTLPRLRHLELIGGSINFVETIDYNESNPESSMRKINSCVCPLETFKFSAILLDQPLSYALRIFKRLKNLSEISIISFFPQSFLHFRKPGEVGQILQKYCPNIQSIKVSGQFNFWLFRLPPLPEVTDKDYSDIQAVAGEEVFLGAAMTELQLTSRKYDPVDMQILLQGIFFPQLTRLSVLNAGIMGSQDLLALATMRSQFLTHLELHSCNMFEKEYGIWQDTSSYFSAAYNRLPADLIEAGIDPISVHQLQVGLCQKGHQLRRRKSYTNIDYMFLLETCSALKVVTIHGGMPFNSFFKNTPCYNNQSSQGSRAVKTACKWACEGSLESLPIGFLLSNASNNDHRLIWRQLGRLRKLKTLSLAYSNLIPSLDYGLDELVGPKIVSNLEGEVVFSGADGREATRQHNHLRDQNPILKEISSLGVMWGVDDKRTVQWFAKSFPNMTMLALNFRKNTPQHERIMLWLSEVDHSPLLELVFLKC
ncbi:hypothetical protein FBU30_008870 [Linnemannia zychae]|nr:hypothetical protein FBU30_008870 [Linnemannia zychae]